MAFLNAVLTAPHNTVEWACGAATATGAIARELILMAGDLVTGSAKHQYALMTGNEWDALWEPKSRLMNAIRDGEIIPLIRRIPNGLEEAFVGSIAKGTARGMGEFSANAFVVTAGGLSGAQALSVIPSATSGVPGAILSTGETFALTGASAGNLEWAQWVAAAGKASGAIVLGTSPGFASSEYAPPHFQLMSSRNKPPGGPTRPPIPSVEEAGESLVSKIEDFLARPRNPAYLEVRKALSNYVRAKSPTLSSKMIEDVVEAVLQENWDWIRNRWGEESVAERLSWIDEAVDKWVPAYSDLRSHFKKKYDG